LERFVAQCVAAGIVQGAPDPVVLAPAVCLPVQREAWRTVAEMARASGLRWSAFWASEAADGLEAFAVLEAGGRHLVLRAAVPDGQALPSQAPVYSAADRPERHAHDLLGIVFAGQLDDRRWTRHAAWAAGEFPLRRGHTAEGSTDATPPDVHYPFATAHGGAVVEIPVGPVHAGIIEPGHFRFLAVGETVLNLEERLGYVHKGIEKLAVGRDAEGLARLAARVSGDSTVAHGWAACQALERALGVEPPERALYLRAVMLERERIANHIGDIGAICTDVAFSFGQYQLSRLREEWQRASGAAFGHRLMMDRIVPGGVATDLTPAAALEMAGHARSFAIEFADIIARLEDSESLEDRLMTTGRLAPEVAALLGVVGYVGKASGLSYDVRADSPHPPYDRFPPTVPGYRAGDVAARARVRVEETLASLEMLGKLLQAMPGGPVRCRWPREPGAGEGLGIIEGWRGELLCYVRLGDDGRVERFFPRDPSWLIWPALELLIQGNIVPDFPVCNKSVNGSYAGQDL
jgi:Ni,Fe-hydrogenase III large subunit/NADH:ubiquinone oxidoreductase subunit C